MSKLRKLQVEIDQCLKKINEGCADWDKLWNKLEETDDPTQREKIIVDMKRDLKKLQRLREQVLPGEVRGWAASGDVKDDSALQQARRDVENQMERFKLLEKEIKVKAFSSAGLSRDTTDPLIAAKWKCADWLNDMVSQLETQVEQLEADLEALGPLPRGKAKPQRALELERSIQRHQAHITKLEQVLRLLENDQVSPEEVDSALKDGLEYYLECSQEPDFQPDEGIYDSLPLSEVDETVGRIWTHTPKAGTKTKAQAAGEEGEGEEGAEPIGSPGSGPPSATKAGKGKAKAAKGEKAGKAGKGDKASAKQKEAAAEAAAGGAATPRAGHKPIPPPPGLVISPAAAAAAAAVAAASVSAGAGPASPAAAGTPPAAAGPAGAGPLRSTSFKQAATAGALRAAAAAGSPPAKQQQAQQQAPAPPQQAQQAQQVSPEKPETPAPAGQPAAPAISGTPATPATAITPRSAGSSPAVSPAPLGPVSAVPAAPQLQLSASAASLVTPAPSVPGVSSPMPEPAALGASPASPSMVGGQPGLVPSSAAAAAAATLAAVQQARPAGFGLYDERMVVEQAQQAQQAQQARQAALLAQQAQHGLMASVAAPPLGLSPLSIPSQPTSPGGRSPLAAAVPTAVAASPFALRSSFGAGYGSSVPESPHAPALNGRAPHPPVTVEALRPAQSPFATPYLQQQQGQLSGEAPPLPSGGSSIVGLDAQWAAEQAAAAEQPRAPAMLAYNHMLSQQSSEAVPGSPSMARLADGAAAAGAAPLAQVQPLSEAGKDSRTASAAASLPEQAGQQAEAAAPFGLGARGLAAEGAREEAGRHRVYELPWQPTLADLQMIDVSMHSRPQHGDADWLCSNGSLSHGGGEYVPARPVVTPASYPNEVHPSLKQEATFAKLSTETDFFAFYFEQGTRQQLFAANQLKLQGWRFHTEFNAWFARQSAPKVVTETYEQGPLVYFDCQLHNITPSGSLAARPVFSGWCPRVSRPDFMFEYQYMEQVDTSAPSD